MLQLTRHTGEAVVISNVQGTTFKVIKVTVLTPVSAKRCNLNIYAEKSGPHGIYHDEVVFFMDVKEQRVIATVDEKPLITLHLVDIARGLVRLGFDAPRHIKIDREENA